MALYEHCRISYFLLLYTLLDKDAVLDEPAAFLDQKFQMLYMIIMEIFVSLIQFDLF